MNSSTLKLSALDWLFMVLLVVGGLNWALLALFQLDLVASLFGTMTTLAKVVYVLVGVSAVYWAAKALMSLSSN